MELRATNETQNDLSKTCIKNPSVNVFVANMVVMYMIFWPAKLVLLLRFLKNSVTRSLKPNKENITPPDMRISSSHELSCSIFNQPGVSSVGDESSVECDLLIDLVKSPIRLVVTTNIIKGRIFYP